MNQTLTKLKGDIHSPALIVKDFNILISIKNRKRQKINKYIEDINNPIEQLNLIGIYRTLYPIK